MENMISTFMCVSNPLARGDSFIEAIFSHLVFSDEFLVIDGSSTDGSMDMIKRIFHDKVRILEKPWPQGKGNWTWEEFPKHWNFAIDNCRGKWVCATESDHIFHEKDANSVRYEINRRGKGRTHLNVDKLVSSTWWAWQSKTKFPLFINKGEFPDIGYGIGDVPTDLAYPIHRTGFNKEYGIPTGPTLKDREGSNLGLYFWNYDKTFKTKEQIMTEREAANWAWNNSACVKLQKQAEWLDEKDACEKLVDRMRNRYFNSPLQFRIPLYHPEVMSSKLQFMTKPMLGFSLWGAIGY